MRSDGSSRVRRSPMVVEYEPQWIVVTSWILISLGALSLIPFTMEWYDALLPAFGLSFLLGVVGLMWALQPIGWRLELVSNTLYYQKFNLFSSWKQRRSKEYTLNTSTIDRMLVEPRIVVIGYNGNKQLVFRSRFGSSRRSKKLQELAKRIQNPS